MTKLDNPVEGDYIETLDGLFFTVKGIYHPEGFVIAYLRYVIDPDGNRMREGMRFRRVYDLSETQKILNQRNFRKYLNKIPKKDLILQSVPINQIKTIYKPVKKLEYLLTSYETQLETLIIKFVKLLSHKSEIHLSNFGVSGSLLIGLETNNSDVDLIVYGKNEGKKVYDSLKKLREEIDWISPYNEITIGEILNSRWNALEIDLKKISRIEENKILHGKLNAVDYFIRLINLDEALETKSIPIKKIITRVNVIDSSESIFTPCRYYVESTQSGNKYDISELLSYRGKFTEQVNEGIVEVKGTLEKVFHPDGTFYRIVMGNQGDYLVPIEVM